MRYSLYSLLLLLVIGQHVKAQDRRTYPIDTCLYFMEPFNFRILQAFDLPNGNQGNNTLFRSIGNPDLLITGKGVWAVDPDALPVPLENNSTGQLLMTVPEPPPGSGGWPGGQPPYPIVLYGFLGKIGSTIIDPPIPMTMRVREVNFEETTQ
ncbi:MAG: hypothetical protein KDC44_01165, partial [Phaeodactylibacter sp.]|nr:hypothetical protein [Phaeodactylibacter sp.]